MNSYDLALAFQAHLKALAYTGKTIEPEEVFDPAKGAGSQAFRRAFLMADGEEFAGFGNGRFSRVTGLYQIDFYVLRTVEDALKALKTTSNAHVNHFYPAHGRGLTLTQSQTSAHILKRPTQRYFGLTGSYLREIVEVEFYVDVPAVG